MAGTSTVKNLNESAKRSAKVGAWVLGVALLWPAAAAVLHHGMPLGIVFHGVVFGSLYALIAIGLVLIYRANRVVNFAQAQFGAVAAVIAIELVVHWHVPYVVGVPAGLLIALLTGALVNVAVISRFRRAPRLILSVATIGLAQILTGIATLIPLAIGASSGKLGPSPFSTPFKATFFIYPV